MSGGDRWRQLMRDHETVVAERDRAEATIARVRELHRPRHIIGRHHKCDACDVAYPCPTIAAIEGTDS